MIEYLYFVMLVFLLPLFIACFVYCDLRQFRERVFHWFLVIYDQLLKQKVKKQQNDMEKAHYKTLYLNEDDQGAYVLLEGRKVYLKAMRAKPLTGFLAGSNYYTTDESEKFVEITPKRRF